MTKLYVSGGLVVSHDSIEEMRAAMGLDVDSWNPLEGMNTAPGAISDSVEGQEWKFTAAAGACLATLEEA